MMLVILVMLAAIFNAELVLLVIVVKIVRVVIVINLT
ncbi:MAG TPA: hypothetical protein [Caudoviricetes sp.]|nr:MAG TPA: hypothetical protein [Caudoviricetes sp.]